MTTSTSRPSPAAVVAPVRRRLKRSPVWRLAPVALVVMTAAVVATYTRPGAAAAAAGYRFLELYSGVLALVALSVTVMGGFIATGRTLLPARHRVTLQVVHKLVAILAVFFLAIHIALKVAGTRAGAVDVVVPFLMPPRRLQVGMGTLAMYLIGVVLCTGLARRWFAHSRRPGLWRAVHVLAYPTWFLAIVHGLGSGRHAAGWVTASYVACAGAVSLGVMVRLSGSSR